MNKSELENKSIIFFDGVCNLCNSSVNFVIDHDKKEQFHFASLQSEAGQAFLAQNNFPTQHFKSFILSKNGRVYKKSRAALEVSRMLGGVWQLLYVFVLVPPFIRNGVYDYISANRYKFFGKSESCRMPTPALQERFL